jgi:hypothetical protein
VTGNIVVHQRPPADMSLNRMKVTIKFLIHLQRKGVPIWHIFNAFASLQNKPENALCFDCLTLITNIAFSQVILPNFEYKHHMYKYKNGFCRIK